jgi:hypothetical protein
LRVDGAGSARIAGGTVDDRLRVEDGASLTVVGGDFRIDGELIAGLETVGNTIAFDIPASTVLSGTLADGTPFAITARDGDVVFPGALMLEAAELPPVGPALVDAATDPIALGVRSGQTLVVGLGATVPHAYNAGRGSRVDINGGAVGSNFEAVSAEVNLVSGSVGEYFDALDGSVVTMSGGELGFSATVDGGSRFDLSNGIVSSLSATRGGIIRMSGGQISSGISAREGAAIELSRGVVGSLGADDSIVDVSGGEVRGSFAAGPGSNVVIRGGRFGDAFRSSAGSSVVVQGAEFHMDGIPVEGLSVPGDMVSVNVPADAVVSGTLADGTPFAFGKAFRSSSDTLSDGTLTLEFVEPPAVGPTTIHLPTDAAPLGVRGGQTLIVDSGGVVPDNVTAGVGSRVEVLTGGAIGANFEAVGAEVLVSGGSIGPRLDIFAGATLTMTGGVLGAQGGSADSVNVFGGVLNLRGGSVEPALIADVGAEVNLFGYGFAISGVPIEGLALGEAFTILERGSEILSGYLADGSPFNFNLLESSGRISDAFSADTTLTVTLVEPEHLAGDYNADGVVDAADYVVWRKNLGSTFPLPNETTTLGEVTAEDYDTWRSSFGASNVETELSTTIPEPASSSIMMLSILCAGLSRFSRGKRALVPARFGLHRRTELRPWGPESHGSGLGYLLTAAQVQWRSEVIWTASGAPPKPATRFRISSTVSAARSELANSRR